MKNQWLFLWLVLGSLIACNKPVHAAYFHVFGGPGYQKQIIQEACFNPKAPVGDVMACTSIPVITHSWRDGYFIIPNEDWDLLAVGGSWGPNSVPMLLLGPEANLMPALKNAALASINAFSNPESFPNLKSLLAPSPSASGPDVAINLGLKWGFFPNQAFFRNSLFLISVGPSLSF